MISTEIPSKKMMNADWSDHRFVGEHLHPQGQQAKEWLVIGKFGDRCIVVSDNAFWNGWLLAFRGNYTFEYRKGGMELWAIPR